MSIYPDASDAIASRLEDGIGHLVLDRPRASNALHLGVTKEIADRAEELVADGARVIVLQSTSAKAFSAGMDLHVAPKLLGLPSAEQARELAAFTASMARFDRIGVPTIAKISGAAAGAGFSLASLCDLRVATPWSQFWLPELALGVPMATEGFARIARLVGLTRAADLVLTGRRMGAIEAAEAGFLTTIATDEEIDGVVDGWATQLAALPPLLAGVTTRQLNDLASSMMPLQSTGVDLLVMASKDAASREASQTFVREQLGS